MAGGLLDRLLRIDRRWIFLLVAPERHDPDPRAARPARSPRPRSTQAAFDFIETLKPGDVVWLSFDYGPSSAPENDPMAEGFMRHCLTKDLRIIVCALYPLGGLGLANNSVARVAAEFPNKKYGVDYVNLGYKDGAEAVMRRLGENIADAFPTDVSGTPISEFPIFNPGASIRGGRSQVPPHDGRPLDPGREGGLHRGDRVDRRVLDHARERPVRDTR